MAANLQGKRAIGLGRRLTNQILAVASAAAVRDPALLPPPPACAAARGAHASAYDKNPDDQGRPSTVPNDVIEPQSEKYWGPHPTTGVFGPADSNAGPEPPSSAAASGGGSVLDQAAWFRPLEDVDKPPQP